jgi:hypothetical protein
MPSRSDDASAWCLTLAMVFSGSSSNGLADKIQISNGTVIRIISNSSTIHQTFHHRKFICRWSTDTSSLIPPPRLKRSLLPLKATTVCCNRREGDHRHRHLAHRHVPHQVTKMNQSMPARDSGLPATAWMRTTSNACLMMITIVDKKRMTTMTWVVTAIWIGATGFLLTTTKTRYHCQ